MDREQVRAYFNAAAARWDQEMVRREDVIQRILDNANVGPGADVLDVACGTGVLIPDYLRRRVRSVVGVDLSPAMAEQARRKFPRPEVRILCGDAMTTPAEGAFDCILVYTPFRTSPMRKDLSGPWPAGSSPAGRFQWPMAWSREEINPTSIRALPPPCPWASCRQRSWQGFLPGTLPLPRCSRMTGCIRWLGLDLPRAAHPDLRLRDQ